MFARVVRGHWGIENRLHWMLDTVFREDLARLRSGNAPENMAIIRHVALNLLSRAKPITSFKNRRKKAGWDVDYLETVLRHTAFKQFACEPSQGNRLNKSYRRIPARREVRFMESLMTGGRHVPARRSFDPDPFRHPQRPTPVRQGIVSIDGNPASGAGGDDRRGG